MKKILLSVKNTFLFINGTDTKISPGINSIYPVAEISILKPYKNTLAISYADNEFVSSKL